MKGKLVATLLSRLNDQLFSEKADTLRLSVPGITITIPNWNHEGFLPRAVRSALLAVAELKRHNVPAEVLVMDDYSRDGSLTLLRQLEALYYEDGLRVFAMEGNRGAPSVRNTALTKARYRYMAFLDADNEIMPENIYGFYRSIQQTRAAVVYGNVLCKEQDTDNTFWVTNNESFQTRIFTQSYTDTFALLDREQLFDVGGQSEETNFLFPACEDWELYLHIAANGNLLVFVPLVFGTYYVNAGSLWQQAKQDPDIQTMTGDYFRRVFNQLGLRQAQPLNTRHLRYHPDIGYI